MQDKELSVVLWSGGILLGIIGALITFGGSVLGYVFTRHRSDNDCDHTEMKELIEKVNDNIVKVSDDFKADIVRIHERLDKHLEISHD